MKKDIEWLREEVYALYPSSHSTYVLKKPDMLLKTKMVDKVIELIDQLDKPENPVIPQFVADYIELNKGWSEDRQEYIEIDSNGLWLALDGNGYGMPNSVSDWLFNEEKVETFAKAWINGYEVEREPLYYVRENNYLLCEYNGEVMDYVEAVERGITDLVELKLTKKEIKDYDKRFLAFAEEVKR